MDLKGMIAMEVPLYALKQVASVHEVKAKAPSSEEYAEALVANKLTHEFMPVLLKEFRYAGNTAVNLMKPLSGVRDDLQRPHALKAHFIQHYGGENLFTEYGIRVPVTNEPTLYRVDEYENHLVLCFTHLGRERRYLEDYELVRRRPQVVDFVLVHFNPFVVEVRASFDNSKRYLKALGNILGADADGAEWFHVTQLTEAQIYLLSLKLGARLAGSKHKMTEGVYGTKEVTKALSVPDLLKTAEYQQEFKGKPLVNSVWEFDYRYDLLGVSTRVSFSVSKEGGLRFYSQVGEEIIRSLVAQIITVQADVAAAASRESLISMLAFDRAVDDETAEIADVQSAET